MKHFLIAIALAFAANAAASNYPPRTPAPAPAPAPVPAAVPAAPAANMDAKGLPPGCAEKLRAHADKMKKELALTDAQAAAMRNEMQRFHGQLMTARADHRSAVARILTPEQLAKMEGKHSEKRQKRMEACGADMDDDHDDEHGSKNKRHKEKH